MIHTGIGIGYRYR